MINILDNNKMLWLIVAIVLIFTACGPEYPQKTPPKVRNGILDLSQWNFQQDGTVKLDGQWEFYWRQLLSPRDFTAPISSEGLDYFKVPEIWNDAQWRDKALPHEGFGTYRLTVVLNGSPKIFAVKTGEIYTAYKIWINGKPIFSSGKVGKSEKESTPKYSPNVTSFALKQTKVELILQVTNFAHKDGGVRDSIEFGLSSQLHQQRELSLVLNFILFGAILIMAFYHFALFLLRRDDASNLLFGLFCLIIALRIPATGDVYFSTLFPSLTWRLNVTIIVLGYYLALPVFTTFIYKLYPREFSLSVLRFFQVIGAIFSLIVLVTPPKIFCQTELFYQLIILFAVIYLVMVLVKGVINKRDGAIWVIGGLLVLISTIINDILYAQHFFITGYQSLLQYGLFVFIFVQSYIISQRFSKSFAAVKAMAEEIKIKEENYRRIFEEAFEGIYQVNNEGKILTANPAFIKLLGYKSKADIMAAQIPMVRHYHFKKDAISILKTLEEQGEINQLEVQIDKIDGTVFWATISARLIKEISGQKTYEGTMVDITERKEKERAIIAKEAAEAKVKVKSDFLANMSHEIRTPMNAIVGLTELTLKTDLTSEQADFLDKVLGAANSLLGIINDILDISKIEAGKLLIEHIPFNLEETFSSLADLITLRAHQKGIEFLYHIEDAVPLCLQGDPLRLGQVLINLTNNAIKFTAKGEVVIKVELFSEQEKSDPSLRKLKLLFSVKDMGSGIPKEQMGKVFQSFSQADSSTTRKYGGTGLGLAICKSLVEKMGGNIWVESEVGEGSCFYFSVILGVDDNHLEGLIIPDQIKKLHPLIVEGNNSARIILKSILSSLSIEADERSSIEEVRRELEQNRYDLIFIDYQRDNNDGIETKIVMNKLKLLNIPIVIICSPYEQEQIQAETEDSIRQLFLAKPFSSSMVINTLFEAVNYEIDGAVGPQAQKSTSKNIEEIPLFYFKNKKVLLVEDDKINQLVATEFLKQACFKITVAADGRQAIEALKEQDFDLILMDIEMPEMDGLEVTKIIRSEPRYQDVPIIAMTAHAMAEHREKSLKAGMNDHINKPFSENVLFSTLKKWIKQEPTNAEITDPQMKTELTGEQLPAVLANRAIKNIGGDQELYMELVANFLDCYQNVFTEITANKDGNFRQAQRLSHSMRSSAIYIGAEKLADLATSLESELKNGESDKLSLLLEQFKGELDLVFSSLRKLQHNYSG